MALKPTPAALLSAVLALGGCSFASDALFPSLSGPDPAGRSAQQAQQSPQAKSESGARVEAQPMAEPPALGRNSFEPSPITPGAATGTFVGAKVSQMREELRQLQGAISTQNGQLQTIRNQTVQDSQRYHGTVAAINARLQVGTTPGNPVLMQQWNGAQKELDAINEDIARMNNLSNDVAATSSMSVYLLDSVRAARGLSGAVDEDHRQLRILEDETNRTVVLIERLLTELSGDVQRQQTYTANERANLNTLALAVKNGQLYGQSLANRGMTGGAQYASLGGADLGSPNRPLVVIRFDKPNVAYEQQLYTAVSRALERRPQASFELVAVTPAGGAAGQAAIDANTARRSAEQVLRSLNNMGLPAGRIKLSAASSDQAQGSEVHLYVR